MTNSVDDEKYRALSAQPGATVDDKWRQRMLTVTGLPPNTGMNYLERQFWATVRFAFDGTTVASQLTKPLDDVRFAYLKAAFPAVSSPTVDDYLLAYWKAQ